jgi:hypothetical protein
MTPLLYRSLTLSVGTEPRIASCNHGPKTPITYLSFPLRTCISSAVSAVCPRSARSHFLHLNVVQSHYYHSTLLNMTTQKQPQNPMTLQKGPQPKSTNDVEVAEAMPSASTNPDSSSTLSTATISHTSPHSYLSLTSAISLSNSIYHTTSVPHFTATTLALSESDIPAAWAPKNLDIEQHQHALFLVYISLVFVLTILGIIGTGCWR